MISIRERMNGGSSSLNLRRGVQDLINDLLWDSWRGGGLGFAGGGAFCFRGFRTHSRSKSWARGLGAFLFGARIIKHWDACAQALKLMAWSWTCGVCAGEELRPRHTSD